MGVLFDQAINKISSIDFKKDEYRKYSVNVLFTEYLRRMTIFLKYICEGKSTGRYFLVRAAKEIGKEFEIDVDALCPNVSQVTFYFARQICSYYLEWAKLADDGDPIAIKFLDVYDPLIMFIEIGGRFRKEHGFIDVYKCAIHANYSFSSIAKIQPIDISKAALEKYDEDDYFEYILIEEQV